MIKREEKYFWISYIVLIVGIAVSMLFGNQELSGILLLLIISCTMILSVESIRGVRNVLLFYLIDIPFFLAALSIFTLWFIVPVLFYFSNDSSIYYTLCLELLDGVIGESFWVILYLVVWGIIGLKFVKKLGAYFNLFSEMIKSIPIFSFLKEPFASKKYESYLFKNGDKGLLEKLSTREKGKKLLDELRTKGPDLSFVGKTVVYTNKKVESPKTEDVYDEPLSESRKFIRLKHDILREFKND